MMQFLTVYFSSACKKNKPHGGVGNHAFILKIGTVTNFWEWSLNSLYVWKENQNWEDIMG
jgi:hypothetical protein